ncbi:hypothetical protein [Roseovarius aestuariivivens]|uniref:hypothetical protein n=1 Tax=Roseovarius aestuariivivens TaxID=1888910 RepID=UPI001436A342|nr:hypothetical protein [Roseovarius aestuariivivens]
MSRLFAPFALAGILIGAPALALAVTVTDITPDLTFPKPKPDPVTQDDTGIDN